MNYISQLQRATTMTKVDPENGEYWRGYARGLRRSHHRDGFSGADPKPL